MQAIRQASNKEDGQAAQLAGGYVGRQPVGSRTGQAGTSCQDGTTHVLKGSVLRRDPLYQLKGRFLVLHASAGFASNHHVVPLYHRKGLCLDGHATSRQQAILAK